MAFAYKQRKSFLAGWMDEYGRQQRKTVPAKTLSEARRMAEEMERKAWLVREGIERRKAPELKLEDAVKLYLESLPSDYATRKDLEQRLRGHILPGLKAQGITYVSEVKPFHVQRLLASAKRLPAKKRSDS